MALFRRLTVTGLRERGSIIDGASRGQRRKRKKRGTESYHTVILSVRRLSYGWHYSLRAGVGRALNWRLTGCRVAFFSLSLIRDPFCYYDNIPLFLLGASAIAGYFPARILGRFLVLFRNQVLPWRVGPDRGPGPARPGPSASRERKHGGGG